MAMDGSKVTTKPCDRTSTGFSGSMDESEMSSQPGEGSSRFIRWARPQAFWFLATSLIFVVGGLAGPWASIIVRDGSIVGRGEITLWKITGEAKVGEVQVVPRKTLLIDDHLCDSTPVPQDVCDKVSATRSCLVLSFFFVTSALLLSLLGKLPWVTTRWATASGVARLMATLLSVAALASVVAAMFHLYALQRDNAGSVARGMSLLEHSEITFKRGFVCTCGLIISALITVVLQATAHSRSLLRRVAASAAVDGAGAAEKVHENDIESGGEKADKVAEKVAETDAAKGNQLAHEC